MGEDISNNTLQAITAEVLNITPGSEISALSNDSYKIGNDGLAVIKLEDKNNKEHNIQDTTLKDYIENNFRENVNNHSDAIDSIASNLISFSEDVVAAIGDLESAQLTIDDSKVSIVTGSKLYIANDNGAVKLKVYDKITSSNTPLTSSLYSSNSNYGAPVFNAQNEYAFTISWTNANAKLKQVSLTSNGTELTDTPVAIANSKYANLQIARTLVNDTSTSIEFKLSSGTAGESIIVDFTLYLYFYDEGEVLITNPLQLTKTYSTQCPKLYLAFSESTPNAIPSSLATWNGKVIDGNVSSYKFNETTLTYGNGSNPKYVYAIVAANINSNNPVAKLNEIEYYNGLAYSSTSSLGWLNTSNTITTAAPQSITYNIYVLKQANGDPMPLYGDVKFKHA